MYQLNENWFDINQVNTPWVESPFFEDILHQKNLSTEELNEAKFYHENGFLVLKNFISEDLIDVITNQISHEYPNTFGEEPKRHQDLWQKYDGVKKLASYKPILDKLQMLYGRNTIPFQTLNFKYGTQQHAHSDSIHFSSLPSRFMCGVWVAFEEIHKDNGPLFYYPKSHKLQEYNYYHLNIDQPVTQGHYQGYELFINKLVEAHGFERLELNIQKGDLLIWASNLIHGGAPVNDQNLTRWSQVTHYYFDDCTYYTPMFSDMFNQKLFLRDNIVNIGTGEKVVNRQFGENIDKKRLKR